MKVQQISIQSFNKINFKGRSEDSFFAQMAKDMFAQEPDSFIRGDFTEEDSEKDDFGGMMSSRDSVLKQYADVNDININEKPEQKQIDLETNFKNTLKNLGIDDVNKEFYFFSKAYENRDYHSLEHIENMIDNYYRYQKASHMKLKNPDLFEFAVYMHDFYNGIPCDVNLSAAHAKKILKTSSDPEIAKQGLLLEKLITATDHKRDLSKSSHEEKLIADLDLMILAADTDEYEDYAKKVRNEYQSYSDEQFKKGRIDVLRNFLNKDHIYSTTFFRANYEQKARENIENELTSLYRN